MLVSFDTWKKIEFGFRGWGESQDLHTQIFQSLKKEKIKTQNNYLILLLALFSTLYDDY